MDNASLMFWLVVIGSVLVLALAIVMVSPRKRYIPNWKILKLKEELAEIRRKLIELDKQQTSTEIFNKVLEAKLKDMVKPKRRR